jgi:hypothetical protein
MFGLFLTFRVKVSCSKPGGIGNMNHTPGAVSASRVR